MEVGSQRYIKHEAPIITAEIRSAMMEALNAGLYTLGEITKQFEAEFAAIVGAKHAVAVSSGTTALHLALLSVGIGPGDKVVMAANVYPAVADCIRLVGAVPALADVDPLMGCLDPATVEPLRSNRTRAVTPLHMYGHPVDMDPLIEIAKAHDLVVIEDGAHALGTKYRGRLVGSIDDVAIFSTARKHITTGGIGGMVTTNRAVVVPQGGLPASDRLSAQNITLTVRPGLTSDDIEYVCNTIAEIFHEQKTND